MSEAGTERRYDERQFALILRKAAALQQSDATAPARAGLSLAEIESIAAEAGIEAVYVRQAAGGVASDSPAAGWRLLGGRARMQDERELALPLDREGLARAVEIARAEFGRHGATREVLDGIEWTGRDDYGTAWVMVHAHGGPPRVVVGADRTNAAWVLGILLPLGGLLAGALTAGALGLEPGVAVPAAGAAGGLLTARTLWRRTVVRWQARVARVLDRLSGEGA
jgi:hypothetical protein